MSDGRLLLATGSGEVEAIALADLVRLADSRDLRVGHRGIEGWRLVLEPPVDPDIAAALSRRTGTVGPRPNAWVTIPLIAVAVSLIATAALILAMPDRLARSLPLTWERRMGAAFDLPIDFARCDNAAARAALHTMVERVDPHALRDGFSIDLLDVSEANAAALPGGRMVVFRGMVDELDDADAIAAVVAHEIAHVRRRHVAAAMIRQMGIGALVMMAGGGTVAGNAGQLTALKFSRDAEAEADGDAIAMLNRAGIDPRPAAAAFEQFHRESGGDGPSWLASHPASRERAARFRAAWREGSSYRPALPAAQADALKQACRD